MKKICMFLLALVIIMGYAPAGKVCAQEAGSMEDTVKIVYDGMAYVECVINNVYYRIWEKEKYAVAMWGATEGTVLEIPSSVTLNGAQYPVTEFNNEIGLCEVLPENYDWRSDYEELNLPDSIKKAKIESIICKKINIPKHTEVFLDMDIDNGMSIVIPEDHDYYALKGDFIYDKKDAAKIHYVLGASGDVRIPQGIKYVGSLLKNSKIKTLSLPTTLEEIGPQFATGTSIKTIDLSKTKLKKIPTNAFWHSGLQTIKFPRTLLEIEDNAFKKSHLKKVVIPNKVTRIGEWAFARCYQLKKISLGKKVKRIENFAFADTAIRELTFPAGVKRINSGVLCGTKSLRKVTFRNKKKLPTCKGYIGNNQATYYVKNKKIRASLKKNFIREGVKQYKIKVK